MALPAHEPTLAAHRRPDSLQDHPPTDPDMRRVEGVRHHRRDLIAPHHLTDAAEPHLAGVDRALPKVVFVDGVDAADETAA
jgi:hypothetical protein